jgi:hypothetical protein
MKPHMKVIQRNGVDIFVTSSLTMKDTKSGLGLKTGRYWAQVNRLAIYAKSPPNVHSLFNGRGFIDYGGSLGKIAGNPIGSP